MRYFNIVPATAYVSAVLFCADRRLRQNASPAIGEEVALSKLQTSKTYTLGQYCDFSPKTGLRPLAKLIAKQL